MVALTQTVSNTSSQGSYPGADISNINTNNKSKFRSYLSNVMHPYYMNSPSPSRQTQPSNYYPHLNTAAYDHIPRRPSRS